MRIPNPIEVCLESPLPATNENMYEILWAARLQVFNEIYKAASTDILHFLALFEKFERECRMGVAFQTNPEGCKEYPQASKVVLCPQQSGQQGGLIFSGRPTLQAVMDAYDDSVDCIVELGCGYGRNLIELQHHIKNPKVSFIGAEYTHSGRQAVEFFNTHFLKDRPIEVTFTDHALASFPFIPRDKKVLVFSCHSLEQVQGLPGDFFIKLANSADNISGVHIEPFGFQAVPREDWQDIHRLHAAFALEKRYNLNMFSCFYQAVEAQHVVPKKLAIHASFAQPENPSSILVWEKT